jgi:hypothetical protein
LREAALSFVMTVRPHRITQLPLDGFSWNLMFEYFSKILEETQFWLISDKNNAYFSWRPTCIYCSFTLISSQNEKFFRQK